MRYQRAKDQMATLVSLTYRCPVTGENVTVSEKDIFISVESDTYVEVSNYIDIDIQPQCPSCGGYHDIEY